MRRPLWEERVEAVANFLFYLCAFCIVALPLLVWLDHLFAGREGGLWVAGAIIVFVFLLPMATGPAMRGLIALLERIKQGELLRPVFVPLRAFAAVLAIYGALKLEYFFIHGHVRANGSWPDVIWQFLTAL